jgi:hypothetical protein
VGTLAILTACDCALDAGKVLVLVRRSIWLSVTSIASDPRRCRRKRHVVGAGWSANGRNSRHLDPRLRLAEGVKMDIDIKVENGKVPVFRTRVALPFKYEMS